MSALVLALLLAVPLDAPIRDRGLRIRGGLSVQGSLINSRSASLLPEFQLEGRAGVQVTRLFSAFAFAKVHFALPGVRWAGIFGAMAELTIADHFFVGAGPLVSLGQYSESQLVGGSFTRVSQTSAVASPGFDVRLGAATGSSRPPSFDRFGFSIGAELMALSYSGLSSTRYSGTTGMPVITRFPPIWVLTPMLSVGIDWR